MEDLIQHAQTLFDENRPPSSPVPSPDVARTSSTLTHGLHLGPEFPRLKSAEAKFVDSTTLHLSTSTVASNRCRSPRSGLSYIYNLGSGRSVTLQDPLESIVVCSYPDCSNLGLYFHRHTCKNHCYDHAERVSARGWGATRPRAIYRLPMDFAPVILEFSREFPDTVNPSMDCYVQEQ